MASPAKTDSTATSVVAAEVVPINAGDRLLPPAAEETSSVSSALEEYGDKAGRLLGDAAYSVGRLYGGIQTRLGDVYDRLSSKSRRVARNTRYEAQTIKQERPFHLLSVIGISAFAAGVAVRIWRSRS